MALLKFSSVKITSNLDANTDMPVKNKQEAPNNSQRINKSSRSLVVVKIGGSTFGSDDTTVADLVKLQKQGFQPVVVHGGGKVVSDWLKKQGIRPKFIRGLRVTDQNTLDVVVGVLTGVVNKKLVGEIVLRGGKAVGLSGVDGGILKADAENPELGFVGTIKKVDVSALLDILDGIDNIKMRNKFGWWFLGFYVTSIIDSYVDGELSTFPLRKK